MGWMHRAIMYLRSSPRHWLSQFSIGAHHNAEVYLDAYIEAAGIWGGKKGLSVPKLIEDRTVEAKAGVLQVKLDLSRFLRQLVKTQNPSNGELSHGIVS